MTSRPVDAERDQSARNVTYWRECDRARGPMSASRRARALAWAAVALPLVLAMGATVAAAVGVDVPQPFWDVLLRITPFCPAGALAVAVAGSIATRAVRDRRPDVPNPASNE
ncbi:hypothetical protein GCM10009846_01160 [Agrococcus versicolor]|uniref:DUF2892 domain-containing protein n=1 Tax=Agrococcus versicolor TaxID=501482 RepID=A0ABP5M8K8_9MICO